MERVSLEIGGAAFDVVSLAGEEGLSRLFRYEVVCSARGRAPSAGALTGQSATITLRDGLGAERHVTGIVADASWTVGDSVSGGGSPAGSETPTAIFRMVVRPAAWDLTLGRSCRAFHDVTVLDIAREVLGKYGVAMRDATVLSHPVSAYRVEYREDDYSFLARLFEEEGIYYWFDHEAGGAMVLADLSTAAPDLAGGAALEAIRDAGLGRAREAILELGHEASAGPSKFAIGSFDPERPNLKVAAESGSGIEVYDAPGGGPRSPEACARKVGLLSEGAKAAGGGVSGRTSSVRVAPGRALEARGHSHDGRYLVTEVTCRVVQRRRGAVVGSGGSELQALGGSETAGAIPYECQFRAIPQSVVFRPASVTPPARQPGLQTGVVVGGGGQEVYPDAAGKVRVQLHWDREGGKDEKAGSWLRVMQRGTAGSMLVPRVGWSVMTLSEEGSVDAPSSLARIFDAEHPPPYKLPANKTRVVLKTATVPGDGSHNEVHFEDRKGHEKMFLEASRDMSVLVHEEKAEHVVRHAERHVGRDHGLGVTERIVQEVRLDQTVTIGNREKLTVSGARAKVVGGDERETVAQDRSLHTGGAHTIQVVRTRKLRVGASLIDVTLGSITANAARMVNILVGAAAVRATPKAIREDVSLASVQTIGAARVELARQGVSVSSGGKLIETAGGAMILRAGATYTERSEKLTRYDVGGVFSAKGPAVTFQAAEKIELTCGQSRIVITDGSVEIRAAKMGTDNATLVVDKATRVDANA